MKGVRLQCLTNKSGQKHIQLNGAMEGSRRCTTVAQHKPTGVRNAYNTSSLYTADASTLPKSTALLCCGNRHRTLCRLHLPEPLHMCLPIESLQGLVPSVHTDHTTAYNSFAE